MICTTKLELMMSLLQRGGMKRLHGRPELYWEYQRRNANEILMPLFREWGFDPEGKKVLEVGCHGGGIIHTFAEAGAECVGLELSQKRIDQTEELRTIKFPMIVGDFCTNEIVDKLNGPFDLIILRDVLEHLLDKETALRNISNLLKDDGHVFFDFCPWHMPFGGHQQALSSLLRFVPFLHWLPRDWFHRVLLFSDSDKPELVKDLLDTYDSRITLYQFYDLLARHYLKLDDQKLYFLNPSYKIKFGWPTISMDRMVDLPLIPEIFASNIYAWVSKW